MAKVAFGVIVANARGSAAGTTFSQNRYGPYVKAKTSPTPATSAAAAKAKGSFAASAKAWGASLNQDQRDAWIALANANPILDIFGNPEKLSGIALFIRVNRNLKLIGSPQISDAPADQTTFNIGALTPTFTPGSPYHLSVTVTNTPAGNDQLVVCASRFTPPGRKVPKSNKVPFVQAFPPAASAPFDFTDYWNARYTYLMHFGAIAVAAYSIRNTNGAAGARYATLLFITS